MPENGLSVAEIADLLEEQPNRIRYQISKHRIKPVRQVGASKLYDKAAIARIKDGLYNLRIQRN
jgi:hypothetical protein